MSIARHCHALITERERSGGFPPCSFHPCLVSLALILLASSLGFAQISYLPGWPVYVNGPKTSSIAIGDVDDDGVNEVIYGEYSFIGQNDWRLFVKAANGADKPGWPVNLAGCAGAPVLADLDDDGKLEIIKPCGGLKVWNFDGTLRWYFPNPSGVVLSNASVADLDNDGKIEIVVTCHSSVSKTFVFDVQGNVKPGWPVSATVTDQSASIGDIDNDGKKEIIEAAGANLFCFKQDGTSCPGFPQIYGGPTESKAILADIDGDGYLEIIFGWERAALRVLKHDGSMFPGYPLPLYARQLAVGDVLRNGRLDLVRPFGSIYAYDLLTGTVLPNFPFSDPSGQYGFGSDGNTLLCDLSSDSGIEIANGAGTIASVPDGKLFAFNMNGQVLSGYPSARLIFRDLEVGCSVNDVDGNGTADICCGAHNAAAGTPQHSNAYCWDTGYPYNLDNVDWAMDGFDIGHTGRWRRLYHINKASSQLSVSGCEGNGNPCYLQPDGGLIAVNITAVREHGGANPAGQDVRYSRTLGCAEYEGPVIDNGDGTYTRMLRAPTSDCTTDVHAWVNEFKLQDCMQIEFCAACLPPGAFNLISPANNSTGLQPTVTLDWQTASDASSYDVYLGTNPAPLPLVSTVSGPPYPAAGIAYGQTHYWTIVARNTYGTTGTATWSFTTCTLPGAFNQLAPANGATGVLTTASLNWEPPSGAESYNVYFGANPASLPLVAKVAAPPYQPTSLAYGQTYYWYIEAVNSCGSRATATWSFTTCTPPAAFDLWYPSDGAANVKILPKLVWNAAPGAASYTLYLGTTNPSPLYKAGITSTQFSISGFLAGAKYYWRVEAVNACGIVSSAAWSFTTACPAPGTFGNPSPANGATNQPLTLTLSWQASSGAERYQVFLGLSPNAMSLAATVSSPRTAISGLASHTTYYWKVTAKNACGDKPGPVWSFTTQFPVASPVRLQPTGASGNENLEIIPWIKNPKKGGQDEIPPAQGFELRSVSLGMEDGAVEVVNEVMKNKGNEDHHGFRGPEGIHVKSTEAIAFLMLPAFPTLHKA
jgi:hypothetical protein